METRISEIQKSEINGKQARIDVLKTAGNRQCFLSKQELHAIVKIESCLLSARQDILRKSRYEKGEAEIFGHEEDSRK